MSELPIVCTLQPGELNRRTAQLLPGLARAATSVVAIADGYRFEFEASSAILDAIAAAIDAERQCCRFLRFRLTVEPDGGPVTLEVCGPAGSHEFLTAMIQNA